MPCRPGSEGTIHFLFVVTSSPPPRPKTLCRAPPSPHDTQKMANADPILAVKQSDWDNLMARVQQGSRLSKTAPLRKSSRRLVRRQLPDWATSPSLCDSRDLHDTTASPAVRGGASLPDSLAVIAPPALTIATEESIDSPRYRGIDRFDQSIWTVTLSGIGRVLSSGSRHRCLVLG